MPSKQRHFATRCALLCVDALARESVRKGVTCDMQASRPLPDVVLVRTAAGLRLCCCSLHNCCRNACLRSRSAGELLVALHRYCSCTCAQHRLRHNGNSTQLIILQAKYRDRDAPYALPEVPDVPAAPRPNATVKMDRTVENLTVMAETYIAALKPTADPRRSPLPADSWPSFAALQPIGQGTNGKVYKVWLEGQQEYAALKVCISHNLLSAASTC